MLKFIIIMLIKWILQETDQNSLKCIIFTFNN